MPGSALCPFVSAKRTFHSLIRDTPDLIITTVVVILIMSAKERTNKMTTVIDQNDKEIDFTTAVNLMDDEIREELHAEMAPCTDQEFFDAYLDRHYAKYGEEFTI